jgi:hypothetical protein
MEHFELEPPDEKIETKLIAIGRSSVKPASASYVRFFSKPKRNKKKSAEAGRPIFEPEERIEILTAGDKDVIVDRPVDPVERYLYRDKYIAFKRGLAQEATGTMLSAWGGVSPERVREYEFARVRTVEQLAEVPDSAIQGLGMGALAERQKAREYIEVMKGNAPLQALRSENEAMKTRLEALERLAANNNSEAKNKQKSA